MKFREILVESSINFGELENIMAAISTVEYGDAADMAFTKWIHANIDNSDTPIYQIVEQMAGDEFELFYKELKKNKVYKDAYKTYKKYA